MAANKLNIVKEPVTEYYRIIETFPTSDGWRSRVCEYREKGFAEAEKELARRQNILDEYYE